MLTLTFSKPKMISFLLRYDSGLVVLQYILFTAYREHSKLCSLKSALYVVKEK